MLHITNGDAVANTLAETDLGGAVLPWRDPMHHGPFPAGPTLTELSRIRIAYLEGDSERATALAASLEPNAIDDSADLNGFVQRDKTLIDSVLMDEVVLWFEHDLLDQLQLAQILDYFYQNNTSPGSLSLICINRFPGISNFRGLGQLSTSELQSLYPTRVRISDAHLLTAAKVWKAFCSSTPSAMHDVLFQATSRSSSEPGTNTWLDCFPFMYNALLRMCEEYPWTQDGLTLTERQILTLIQGGVSNPNRVFVDNMDLESVLYIGDWRTFTHIKQLCEQPNPLIEVENRSSFQHPMSNEVSASEFKSQVLRVTAYGESVLAGQVDYKEALVRNEWIGGVHLNSQRDGWYWDSKAKRFQHHA